MAAVGAINRMSQTPFQGVGYLSKTFQSSQVHTPLNLGRVTNGEESYNGYINEHKSWLTKPTWGNSSLLKGTDTRNLPPTQEKINQQFNLSHLNKSHLHFGGGELSYGRSFPIQAKYDVTSLKRSDVRPTDELIPSSNKVDLRSDIINLPFPTEHPQNSQMPKFALFPAQDSPDDTRRGRQAIARSTSLPSFAPSGCDNYVVAEKIKGSPHRREVVRVLSDSERRPLQWHGHSFNQLVKGPGMHTQQYYPTPPTSVKPDFWDRPPSLSVSPKTADAQRNLEVLNGESEYSRQYSANGPRGATSQGGIAMHPIQGSQGKTFLEQEQSLDGKEEKPYDTTYGKDYTVDVSDNATRPTSILRRSTTKKLNEEKRNKSVKFSEKVAISYGHETSSSSVNDVEKENHQQIAQSSNTTLAAIASTTQRPFTAPNIQRQSILKTTPLLFPSQQTLPYTNMSQSRPSSTGVFGSLRNDLRHLQDNYSRSATHRKFHNEFPENAPDIRRTPDMRITLNERRHVIPEIGCHSYYFHG